MPLYFTIEEAPIVTYKLLIYNKFRKDEKLVEYNLSFITNEDEFPLSLIMEDFKKYLYESLNELEEKEWTQKTVIKIITELMCENPLSHMSFEYNNLEFKRVTFYVKD